MSDPEKRKKGKKEKILSDPKNMGKKEKKRNESLSLSLLIKNIRCFLRP